MTLENMIRAIAGTFVVISLLLGYLVSPYWHLFTAFVGLNLLQSAFTHWCLMEKILIKSGIAESPRALFPEAGGQRPQYGLGTLQQPQYVPQPEPGEKTVPPHH
jgi:DUF2892 family protein